MKKIWNILDTFAGIGGFSYGMEKTGRFKTVGFIELNPYPCKILKRHWPGVPIYNDIREFTAERVRSDRLIRERIDIITGGFPCTDVSLAGKQAGIDGEATGLWRELARCIGEFRPEIAILENVSALLSGDRGGWFGEVLGDLAALGYNVEWHCITASSVGAPHRRDRIFVICTDADRQRGSGRFVSQPDVELDIRKPPQLRNGKGKTESKLADSGRPDKGRRHQSEREQNQRDTDTSRDGQKGVIVADAERPGKPADAGNDRGNEGRAERDSRAPLSTGAEMALTADALAGSSHLADAESVTERAGLRESGEAGERRRRSGNGRGEMPDTLGERLERLLEARAAARAAYRSGYGNNRDWWAIEPDVGRVANGIPDRMERLKALGNAIVPEIATLIAEAIIEREDALK